MGGDEHASGAVWGVDVLTAESLVGAPSVDLPLHTRENVGGVPNPSPPLCVCGCAGGKAGHSTYLDTVGRYSGVQTGPLRSEVSTNHRGHQVTCMSLDVPDFRQGVCPSVGLLSESDSSSRKPDA